MLLIALHHHSCVLYSTKLAEGHAKLSLRSEVTEHDAVMAVYLYEECIAARLGNTAVCKHFYGSSNNSNNISWNCDSSCDTKLLASDIVGDKQ